MAGDLRAAFGANDPWKLVDGGDASVEITITDAPRIYVLDTRYAFIVIGVAPFVKKGEELTLPMMQDVSYALVPLRGNLARRRHLTADDEVDRRSPAGGEGSAAPSALARRARPRSARRGAARIAAHDRARAVQRDPDEGGARQRRPSSPAARASQRSVRRARGGNPNGDDTGEWNISNRELCLFSTFGVSWVVTMDDAAQSSQFLNDAPHMVRDRYVYKWLLVEHQRLCLLALATECADMSKVIDGENFAEMRMRLLAFIATYNFRHVSNEERHDRFYKRVRDALSIDDLLAEVREEVVEIDTQLAARRGELLNHVLAFLTLVLTPVGIMCSIFQNDSVPGPLRLDDFASSSSWLHLITHVPFLVVLAAAVVGAAIYVRIFGVRVIANLFRRKPKKK